MAIPFVVETGGGLPNSSSYLSLQEFKDFSDVFLKDYEEYLDEDLQKGLIQSTLFIDSYFLNRYPGSRKSGQALEWPREKAFYFNKEEIADDVVPRELKLALMETFYLFKSGVEIQPVLRGNGVVTEERVKVDVIEEHKRYNTSSTPKRATFSVLEDAMARITGGMSSFYNLKIMRVGGFE